MSGRLYKLIFRRGHEGFSANEGAAFDLPTATRLVATGVCQIADDEPAREALESAVKEYKHLPTDPLWLAPCVSDHRGGVGRLWIPGSPRGPLMRKPQ